MTVGFSPLLTGAEVDAAFVGRYQSSASIHNGGQAAVFRATEHSGGGSVALKIYYPTSPVDDIWARSDREVTAMKAIDSPSVVRLRDHGIADLRGVTCPFIATDFIEGTTLAALIAAGSIDAKRVARFGIALLSAIEVLWSKNLVHRDITPRNVMITKTDEAVLIDLGLRVMYHWYRLPSLAALGARKDTCRRSNARPGRTFRASQTFSHLGSCSPSVCWDATRRAVSKRCYGPVHQTSERSCRELIQALLVFFRP